ncbi:hypothetical protein QJS64_06870 [Paraclostridium bifermentans]|uniref:Uncharacterized protein n=1 Tax=Paraclostridium bifermentans TaxID=1490 RepID=A0ABY8R7T3_PARBF|nr:hypothetical protein QJS64_06870 [Paraclostridium bifermentans]
MDKEKCCCNSCDNKEVFIGEYVCYCNHVTENDIKNSIKEGRSKCRRGYKKYRSNEK